MNFNRLPAGHSDSLPALTSAGRNVDAPYREGSGAFEFEQREVSIGAIIVRYLAIARKYRYLIAAFVVVALIIGFVSTFMMQRIYSAATTVKIDRAVPKVLNNQMTGMEGGNDPQFYMTQYELIRSRSLAERVAVALNLAQSDFIPQPKQGLLSRALGEEPEMDEATVRARQARATSAVQAGLSVSQSRPRQSFASGISTPIRFGRSASASPPLNNMSGRRWIAASPRRAMPAAFSTSDCNS